MQWAHCRVRGCDGGWSLQRYDPVALSIKVHSCEPLQFGVKVMETLCFGEKWRKHCMRRVCINDYIYDMTIWKYTRILFYLFPKGPWRHPFNTVLHFILSSLDFSLRNHWSSPISSQYIKLQSAYFLSWTGWRTLQQFSHLIPMWASYASASRVTEVWTGIQINLL